MKLNHFLTLALLIILAACASPTAEQSASAWVGGETLYRSDSEGTCAFLEPYLSRRILDMHDCLMIQQTLRHALEYAPDGQVSTWRNPRSENEGKLVIMNTIHQEDQFPIRKYQMTLLVRGKTYLLEGRGRRTSSGQWI